MNIDMIAFICIAISAVAILLVSVSLIGINKKIKDIESEITKNFDK